MHQVLFDEAERFMAKRGEPFPKPLQRYLKFLVDLVQDPKRLLPKGGANEQEDRSLFAKAYARNPEAFLDLMLHLTRFYARRGKIERALRDNPVIAVQDGGWLIRKPISQATIQELTYFIRTRYGLSKLEPKTVARCLERLARVDSKRSANDLLILKALRIFSEHMNPKTLTIPIPRHPESDE